MRFQFFVYGAFSKGYCHYPKISEFITDLKPGFIKGEIYRLPSGYPFISTAQTDSLVSGHVAEIEAPESLLAVLDELLAVNMMNPEKCFLHRSEEMAMVENFTQVPCQLYKLNPLKVPQGSRKIAHGHWQKDLEQYVPFVTQLSEAQKNYLRKLSKAKGREIVPIKVDLSRQLESLELIKDKGRRLALTSLGREVSMFLQ